MCGRPRPRERRAGSCAVLSPVLPRGPAESGRRRASRSRRPTATPATAATGSAAARIATSNGPPTQIISCSAASREYAVLAPFAPATTGQIVRAADETGAIRPDHSPSTFRPAGANHGEYTGDRGRFRQRAGPKGQRHASSGNQARHRKAVPAIHRSERYVDKNQGILSLDAVKKAEQIEKLAHGLKSKIKQSF